MRLCVFLSLLLIVHSSEQLASYADMMPPPEKVVSGYEFLTVESKSLQDDEFANPGMLWVDRGFELYSKEVFGNQSCSSCHGNDGEKLIGIAETYPKIDSQSGELINIEERINLCRSRFLAQSHLPYEDDDLLALTAYVTSKSRGQTITRDWDEELEDHVRAGRIYFYNRRGQMNLSCSQCHNDYWGKSMRGETVSQGHSNGFPTYRFEWQHLGSLHRRFRDCDLGVRAEPHEGGSLIYKQLELYLRLRSEGLTIESPSIRR